MDNTSLFGTYDKFGYKKALVEGKSGKEMKVEFILTVQPWMMKMVLAVALKPHSSRHSLLPVCR